jgi:hypothetical protein
MRWKFLKIGPANEAIAQLEAKKLGRLSGEKFLTLSKADRRIRFLESLPDFTPPAPVALPAPVTIAVETPPQVLNRKEALAGLRDVFSEGPAKYAAVSDGDILDDFRARIQADGLRADCLGIKGLAVENKPLGRGLLIHGIKQNRLDYFLNTIGKSNKQKGAK